jgi:methylmalonyl-CoA mutase
VAGALADGVGAMETGYQRGKIQEESLYYEHRKHDGRLPIIGVNTFINPNQEKRPAPALQRSTRGEKDNQIVRLRDFQNRHGAEAPAMRERLRQAVIKNENVFAVLMDAVRVCSLGQISDTLFEVGGQYRRNM